MSAFRRTETPMRSVVPCAIGCVIAICAARPLALSGDQNAASPAATVQQPQGLAPNLGRPSRESDQVPLFAFDDADDGVALGENSNGTGLVAHTLEDSTNGFLGTGDEEMLAVDLGGAKRSQVSWAMLHCYPKYLNRSPTSIV